ncbi:MAG: hypothetical protein ACP5I4_12365 [Oceanipulchritudo sp.]
MKTVIQFCTALLSTAVLAPVFAQEAPLIIFISDNTSARTSMESLIIEEYNIQVVEDLRINNFAIWEEEMAKPSDERFASYKVASYREVPAEYKNARYEAITSTLDLADDDPADKGFTDLLEAAGYTVYRSETIREEDPITGAVTLDFEFYGDIGEPYSLDGDYRLSQEQIDFLSQADLIIFSNDIDTRGYSKGGREGGVASTTLIEQWNGIPVPMMVMNTVLMATNPFGDWGFGWSYGYSYTGNLLAPYDRREIQGSDRFVFPDMRPVVGTGDPVILEGVTPVEDDRLAIYDTELFPILPRVHRKFSNNPSYNYPESATVILEMEYPSFVVLEVGDIPTRDPLMVEFEKGVPAFTEEICCDQPPLPDSGRIAIPGETRLYFAAGAWTTGLYNLSETGEEVFLNAVAKYAGEPGGNGGGPLTADAWNDTAIGPVWGYSDNWGWSGFMGNVNFSADPWIHQDPFGYFYPAGSFATGEGTAYWMYNPDLDWVYAADDKDGLFQSSGNGFDWDNFLAPRP